MVPVPIIELGMELAHVVLCESRLADLIAGRRNVILLAFGPQLRLCHIKQIAELWNGVELLQLLIVYVPCVHSIKPLYGELGTVCLGLGILSPVHRPLY